MSSLSYKTRAGRSLLLGLLLAGLDLLVLGLTPVGIIVAAASGCIGALVGWYGWKSSIND